MDNVFEVSRQHYLNIPDKKAYIYLNDGENEGGSLTYKALYEQAHAMASNIMEQCEPGDRVLLLLPQGLDYIKSFFACTFCGVIAVPAYPPHSAKHSFERIRAILRDCRPKVIITCPELRDKFSSPIFEPLQQEFDCKIAYVDQLCTDVENPLPQVSGDAIAFLQYTSGSTGEPKGVMVTHHNLIENERLIKQAFSHSSNSTVVGWLPLFHDMGLIGNLLQPFFVGATAILMPPQAFIQKPLRWLQAIAKYKANTSGGPNFAYRLCVDKIAPEEVAGLDLSHWKLAFNGSEKIQASTLKSFCELLAPTGFNEDVLFPCYGMAEATLYVSGVKAKPNYYTADPVALMSNSYIPAKDGLTLVGCGVPEDGMRIEIVEPSECVALEEGAIGEIWLQHESVARGYWQKPELTQEYFGARLAGNDGHWLRTGDLGFKQNNEVIVTGRRKEMLIVCGRNYYPQDIEETVRQVSSACQQDATCAFAVDGPEQEQLVIVQEVKRTALRTLDQEAVIAAISKNIAQQHQLDVADVVLIKPASILKTTSGKIRRLAVKDAYRANELKVIGKKSATSKTISSASKNSERLATLIAHLGVFSNSSQVFEHHTGLFAVAANSVQMIQLLHFLEHRYQVQFDLGDLLECEDIAALDDLITRSACLEQSKHRQVSEELPLALQYLCFEQFMEPQSCKYNLSTAVTVQQSIDSHTLAQNVSMQLRQTPLLRARFELNAGRIDVRYQKDTVAFTSHGQNTNEGCQEQINQLISTPFDLSRSQLYQVHSWEHDNSQTTILILAHHAIADALSMQYLLEQLLGKTSAAMSSYQDYMHAQKISTDPLQFATDICDSEQQLQLAKQPISADAYGCEPLFFSIDDDLQAKLQTFAVAEKTTINHLLQVAYSLVLSRFSEASTISLINPTTTRGNQFVQSIGYFVNPVAVNYQPNFSCSFKELIKQSRSEFFNRLQHAAGNDTDKSVKQHGQALFAYLVAPDGVSEHCLLGGLSKEFLVNGRQVVSLPLATPEMISELDLYLVQGQGLKGKLVFDTQVWSSSFARQFLDEFLNTLPRLVNASFVPVWRMFNVRKYPNLIQDAQVNHTDLIGNIAAKVASQPNAVAVQDLHGAQLSYAELWQQSGLIAIHLVECFKIAPQCLVAIFMSASVNRIVAQLAILRAGASYLPLDTHYPTARCEEILSIAQPALALVDNYCSDLAIMQLEVGNSFDLNNKAVFTPRVYPDNRRAYTIFTSGSTGKPKGVQVSYQGVNQLLFWAQQQYSEQEFSHVLAATSLCFDISVFETLIALALGAKISVIDSILLLDKLPERDTITLINSVPSAVSAVLDANILPKQAAVINLAGEALPRTLVSRLREYSAYRVMNLYGPSEDTVYSTCEEVDYDGKPLIGSTISNTQGYVLDPWLNPVIDGVVGELYLAGQGVAWGYTQQPGLTAQNFIADPFTAVPGQRMYRTGDLVRRLSDGRLDYVGRRDQQVKLRGQRIELEEIESHLLTLADISEAVVIVQEQQLVAYVVCSHSVEQDTWKHSLSCVLPSYIIPSVFVCVQQLPHLANGKVDRKSLPKINVQRQYEAPKDDLEHSLATLWLQELKCEAIGRNDDLFMLGAHSLSVLKVKYQLDTQFDIELEVADLMELRTIAQLAQLVRSKRQVKDMLGELEQSHNDNEGFEEFVI
ncbi:Polyketide synthase PksJ [Pseudoalteromonas holothuriae]|uniref:Polyketide synthase PksJ n=1 Tax=Pseudoalteromonas holothuriae TaxID=2963714 RepID=A0ABM9GDF8_9GAMM|nr:non-ribosomal peptide synthetase [Pseudoalteromonas sp. CIP111951]CAH9050249.1 Polyketide synthase PksJ [Pseudoalteromonas sp. CIP111951]